MFRQITVVVAISILLSACVSSPKPSVEQRRMEVKKMRSETISQVEKFQSNIRQKIASAPGYAVFSNANVNIIFASFAGGYGVVHDNLKGTDIYMKMAEAGLGLGLGIKDFRAIFVFRSAYALDKFVNEGWSFGAHADAAAKAKEKGAAAGAEVVVDDIEIYQITESGLALQATVKGTKYWKDDTLN
jgi:lipid-binding SYLF domain-containing protein